MTELDKAVNEVCPQGENLAKIAYKAYGKSTDFKNFQGASIPSWDELPSSIKTAWTQAAGAVQMTVNGFPPAGSDQSNRCYWVIEAGVVPEHPQKEFTKIFGMTSGEYESEERWEIFNKKMVEAIEYARRLHHPDKLNWVTLKWVWC